MKKVINQLVIYGSCNRCKKMVYHPVHAIIDDDDIPKSCSCGGKIVWQEVEHHAELTRFSKANGRIKLTPTDVLEFCVLFVLALVLIANNILLTRGIGWSHTIWWVFIGSSAIALAVGFFLFREILKTSVENVRKQALQEGIRQGIALERRQQDTENE